MKYYTSYSDFLKSRFGKKLYKICLDGGFTCPNRDGTISKRGCIFCSEGGSGDFSSSSTLSIKEQIAVGKNQTKNKYQGSDYIAYFQAFTNTYAPVEKLREIYSQAISDPCIAAIAIGTRPDCLPKEVIDLLKEFNEQKPVFLELGLQTIHENTAKYIERGYETIVFDQAVNACHEAGLRVTAHLILGLPGETKEMQLKTIDHVNQLSVDGIKLSMLHVLKNTPLAAQYEQNPFPVFTLDEYTDFVIECVEHLRPEIVIERLTGDGPKNLLIAPLWSGNKRLVLNTISRKMKERHSYQGKQYYKGEKLCL